MRPCLVAARVCRVAIVASFSIACAAPPNGDATDAALDALASSDADRRDAIDALAPDAYAAPPADTGVDAPVAPPADTGIDAFAPPTDAGHDAPVARDAFVGPDAYVGPTAAEVAAWGTLMTQAESARAMAFVPGVSIAVVLHGRLAFAGALGMRDVASAAPVTTSTLFRANSMSKMVLAAAAMSLVRDGMLDVHAPITTYLPWLALAAGYDASTITMDTLLTHTSGFPCDTIQQCGSAATLGPRETFFRSYPQPLWAPPGAVMDYSNVGYVLASQALVGAAGVPDAAFEQLVHDRVFVPAGMTTATYDAAGALSLDHATDYILNASGSVIVTRGIATGDCPMLHPSGGVIATPTDYAHLAERFLAGDSALLDASEVAAMEAPHVLTRGTAMQAYGYGLVHEYTPYPTHAAVWHDGELPGSLALTYLVPDRQFAIVIMANASGGPHVVTWQIATDALRLFVPDAFSIPSGVTSPATWGRYAGTYDDRLGTLGTGVVVTLVGSTLHVSAPNATDNTGHAVPVAGNMTQVALDQFTLPDGTAATFFPDATGTFRYLVTRRGIAVR